MTAAQIRPKKTAAKLLLYLLSFPHSLVRDLHEGEKGWQPTTDGRGRTTARAHTVVFVGHMHASEN